MFSLVKSFLFVAILSVASVGWSISADMKSCTNKAMSVQYKIVDQNISISYSGTDSAGKSFLEVENYQLSGVTQFTADMLNPDTLAMFLKAADITSFTSGLFMKLADEQGNAVGSIWFFEFEPDQFSILLISGTSGYALGKTNSCP